MEYLETFSALETAANSKISNGNKDWYSDVTNYIALILQMRRYNSEHWLIYQMSYIYLGEKEIVYT
jgi:hypothetical protein